MKIDDRNNQAWLANFKGSVRCAVQVLPGLGLHGFSKEKVDFDDSHFVAFRECTKFLLNFSSRVSVNTEHDSYFFKHEVERFYEKTAKFRGFPQGKNLYIPHGVMIVALHDLGFEPQRSTSHPSTWAKISGDGFRKIKSILTKLESVELALYEWSVN